MRNRTMEEYGRQRSCHMVFAAEDELTVKLRQEFGGDTTFEKQMDA